MGDRFPSLAHLIAPHPLEDFLANHWEQRYLHVRAQDGVRRDGMLDLAAIDAMLTGRLNRHPGITVVNAKSPVEAADYAGESDDIDPIRLAKLFGGGATIIVNNLDQLAPDVRGLLAKLECELGIHVQANLYMTPGGGAQGFAAHYDSHDVILVQCVGAKHWRLYDSPSGLPMRGERFDAKATKAGAQTAELLLQPGDVLYIPRGLMHDAVAVGDQPSIHVTVGFHAFRWSEVLLEALAAVAIDDPSLRAGVPLGTFGARGTTDDVAATLRAKALAAAAAMRWEAVAPRMRSQFEAEHKEELRGLVADAVATLGPDSRFVRRAGARTAVDVGDTRLTLTVNGRSTEWPAAVAPMLRAALEADGVFDMTALGDELDDAGKVTMLRRLLAEGALTLAR